MAAIIIGKNKELNGIMRNNKRFQREFLRGHDVLDYYLMRKKGVTVSIELIYDRSCERMVKLLDPDMRRSVIGRQSDASQAALSAREIELVRSTCEHTVQEEEIRIEHGMPLLATIVTASPMLGLLGTVWGVLDAFAAWAPRVRCCCRRLPAISSALVTTVVGLLVAIPARSLTRSLPKFGSFHPTWSGLPMNYWDGSPVSFKGGVTDGAATSGSQEGFEGHQQHRYDVVDRLDLSLLITFIITMPAIEQGISVKLPQGKTDTLPVKKSNVVTLDVEGRTYLNNREITLEDLERTLGNLAAEDPEVAVLVRGDERLEYGKVVRVMKILYKVRITRMALVTQSD